MATEAVVVVVVLPSSASLRLIVTDGAAISRILFYFDHNHQHAVPYKETITQFHK